MLHTGSPNDSALHENAGTIYLCDRCQFLGEALSAGSSLLDPIDLSHITVQETYQELEQSDCRICRSLAPLREQYETSSTKLVFIPAHPPSKLKGRLYLFKSNAVPQPEFSRSLGILDGRISAQPFHRVCEDYVDYQVARNWMKKRTGRESNMDEQTPTVDDQQPVTEMFVIDCASHLVRPAERSLVYLALSYVWGKPTHQEEATFPNLPEKLPQTIEDAMTVTKELGYRYLWVDKYCINQKDAAQRTSQIRQMGAIYSNALITIVAAAGSNPDYGLPGISRSRKFYTPYVERVGSVSFLDTNSPATDDVAISAWIYRAWTFQESYFSSQKLLFTDHGMLYMDSFGIKGEAAIDYTLDRTGWLFRLGATLTSRSHMDGGPIYPYELIALWQLATHIDMYRVRDLTHQMDALDAMIGIFELFSQHETFPVYHIWGVPFALGHTETDERTSSYEIAFNWHHVTPSDRRYGFPSWSSFGWINRGGFVPLSASPVKITDSFRISICCANGPIPLDEYVNRGFVLQHSGSFDAPAQLHIQAAITFTFKIAPVNENNPMGGPHAVLETVSEINIHHPVNWDDYNNPPDPGANVDYLAVETSGDGKVYYVVLKENGECHERVGMIRWGRDTEMFERDISFYDATTGDHIIDELLEERLNQSWTFKNQKERSIYLV